MGAAASGYRPRSLPLLRGQIYLPLLSLRSGTEESAVASPPPRAFIGCRPNKQHTITKQLHAVVALVLLRGSVPPYVAPSLPSAAPHRGRRGRRGRLPSNGRRGRRGRLVSSLPVAPLLSSPTATFGAPLWSLWSLLLVVSLLVLPLRGCAFGMGDSAPPRRGPPPPPRALGGPPPLLGLAPRYARPGPRTARLRHSGTGLKPRFVFVGCRTALNLTLAAFQIDVRHVALRNDLKLSAQRQI